MNRKDIVIVLMVSILFFSVAVLWGYSIAVSSLHMAGIIPIDSDFFLSLWGLG